MLLGSTNVKAAHKMLMKLTPGICKSLIWQFLFFILGLSRSGIYPKIAYQYKIDRKEHKNTLTTLPRFIPNP
jgi:hypothetical protein